MQNILFKYRSLPIVLGITTFLIIFFFGQQYYWSLNSDNEFLLGRSFAHQCLYFYTWAGLFYFIYFLAEKFPFEKKNPSRFFVVHILFSIFVGIIHRILTIVPYVLIFFPEKFAKGGLWFKALGGAFDSLLSYWFILGLILGFKYYKENKANQIKAAKLETQLANSQLSALKMQLQPHFLFNTMHSISSLMEIDVKAAQNMLTKLSDLLRWSLDNTDAQTVTIKEELSFLRNYLAIEQTRFSDRLVVHYDIDESIINSEIPNLLLQPFVENSIKHGVAKSPEQIAIKIMIQNKSENLKIVIEDNGNGCINGIAKEGVGITNTRKRLEQLYADSFTLNFECNSTEGFRVEIIIPNNHSKK